MSRVPPSPQPKSFVKPVCSVHQTSSDVRRDADGNWFCLLCYEEYATRRKYEHLGIEVPSWAEVGTQDSAMRSGFNRAARRAARRQHG